MPDRWPVAAWKEIGGGESSVSAYIRCSLKLPNDGALLYITFKRMGESTDYLCTLGVKVKGPFVSRKCDEVIFKCI